MSRALRWAGAIAMVLGLAQTAQAQTIVRYVHTDALGSVVVMTDENREVVERREYEPFGQQLTAMEDGPGYTGHVQDAATGLTYMQQRYYDAAVGSFLSVDPVLADGNSGYLFNRYSYALNDPYGKTDPDGREPRTGSRTAFAGGSAIVKSYRFNQAERPSENEPANSKSEQSNTSVSGGQGAREPDQESPTDFDRELTIGDYILRLLAGSVAHNASMRPNHPAKISDADAAAIGIYHRAVVASGTAAIAAAPPLAVIGSQAGASVPLTITGREVGYAAMCAVIVCVGKDPSFARVGQEERIRVMIEGSRRESSRSGKETPEPPRGL